jgi:hypothetical protein
MMDCGGTWREDKAGVESRSVRTRGLGPQRELTKESKGLLRARRMKKRKKNPAGSKRKDDDYVGERDPWNRAWRIDPPLCR